MYVIRPWHGAKYINIYRFKEEEGEFGCPARLSHWISPIPFFFIFVEEDAIGKLRLEREFNEKRSVLF